MAALAVVAATAPAAAAQIRLPALPANDLEAMLALSGAQVEARWGQVSRAPQPKLVPTPRADCGPDSRPLRGEVQGRVPASAVDSPAAKDGWTCNVTVVGTHPTPGGFRTWSYTDANGHTCAFYDTSLASPANLASVAGGPSPGVVVLDMTDAGHPKQTAWLRTAAMLAPHESLNLNTTRGLLAAEVGNGLTLPGSMAIYDVSRDCRHPELQAETPTAFGHESGFAPDGNTFWVAGGAGYVTAFDVRYPKLPQQLWRGAMYAHGLNLSDDGRTLYQTDPINGNLGILDVSEVQDRKPLPTVRQISRVTWDTVSIPQNSIPITVRGRPYLIEFDEFAFRFNPVTVDDQVGGARIFDMRDPKNPVVVSDLRLEVNQPAAHRAAAGDPSSFPGPLGYAAHYCGVPRQHDPVIVACSFINSGLRVFDIRDPQHPRETAYFVAPPKAGTLGGLLAGDAAFSQPAFDPARRQVWYTDATSGFYALRLDGRAWPPDRTCTARSAVTLTLPRGIRGAAVRVGGRRAKVTRRGGRARVRVAFRGRARVTVRITGRSAGGRRINIVRKLRACV